MKQQQFQTTWAVDRVDANSTPGCNAVVEQPTPNCRSHIRYFCVCLPFVLSTLAVGEQLTNAQVWDLWLRMGPSVRKRLHDGTGMCNMPPFPAYIGIELDAVLQVVVQRGYVVSRGCIGCHQFGHRPSMPVW